MAFALSSFIINHLRIVDAIDKMKHKVIQEYTELLKRAGVGHYDNYEAILLKICFIELGGKLPNPTKIYHRLMT